jgi:hypothetical protein
MDPRVGRILAMFAWVVAAAVSTAAAQESINYASLSGRVTDPTGAVIQGAQVSARQTDTNLTATMVTDREGRFRFPYLRVGPYEITIRQQGFADATRAVSLTVGGAFDVPVSLAVGTIGDTVTVSGETTVIEAARSQIAGTVSEPEVRALPMNGRNFLELALLVPGVSPTNVGGTQLFPETSAIPGVSLSVGSQRNLSNNFIVDGLSANDDAAALSGMPYGVDAIEQFQVVTSGGQAELGRALGGYVNVVTKSGTNVVRGDVYGYFRDDSMNARNALASATLPMNQKQYGASVGGPIFRDRTFYFGNVEQRRLDQSGLVAILSEVVPVINARLAATGYQGPPVVTGVYPNPVHTTNVLAKVDHQFNGRDLFGVRYSLYDVTSSNSRGAGGLNAPSASAGLDNIDQTVALSNTLTLTTNTVNETRVQMAHSDLKAPPTDPIGPAVSIAGIAAFGTSSGSPVRRVNTMVQVVNSLSHQRGAHALRAGFDFLYNDDTITYPRSVRGAYSFSSLANFLAGVYTSTGFTQTFGESVVSQTNPNLGLYAQDEWRAGGGLTINAGLRYDLQFIESITTDTGNVSPRVGFAWSPFADRRTIVRGSAGLFFDRVPLRAVANALLSAGNTSDLANLRQIGVTLAPLQAGSPTFPNILSGVVPSVTLVNLTTMDRDMQNAHSRQASAEIERQIGEWSTVSVGYQYLRGLNLIISINQNVPTCVAAGTNNGCRPNPAYANNNQYSPEAESVYHGLHVSFVQRPRRWAGFRVSYTFSKSMNNVGENFFSSPIDPTDLSKDWGRSDDDQRHRLVVHASLNSPTGPATTTWQRISHDFTLSGILQTYSALPFNITSGVNTIQGTPGRPIVDGEFIPRNSGVGSTFFTAGARLSRSFRLGGRARVDGLVEVFNLTNHRNNLTRNTNFGPGAYPTSPAPTYGQITAVGDPRSVQLGVRFKF